MLIPSKNALGAIIGVAGLLMTAAPAIAHHAFSAEFDAQKPFELKGVVTKGKWVNPHSWVYVDVKGADGTVTNWGFEINRVRAAFQSIAPDHHSTTNQVGTSSRK